MTDSSPWGWPRKMFHSEGLAEENELLKERLVLLEQQRDRLMDRLVTAQAEIQKRRLEEMRLHVELLRKEEESRRVLRARGAQGDGDGV